MKLIRVGAPGEERPGIVSEAGDWLDCSGFGEDWDEKFFGSNGLQRLVAWLRNHQPQCPKLPSEMRLGPPVARPSKLVCVGLNYVTHARESGMEVPKEPVLFMKATTAISGPNDDIVIPNVLSTTGTPVPAREADWEVELALVMAKRCAAVSQADALDYVAGYVVHNDVSEREIQFHRGGQWVKSKSFDTFAPLGPWLVTADEVSDPANLRLWLKLNGKILQDDNTGEMIFGLATLVSYISWHMTLLPGDIISTGTPFGVGLGLSPKRYLRPGDVVELGIDGLGIARQRVVASMAGAGLSM